MLDRCELIATLWSGFPHFEEFAHDVRLDAIRINPAKIPVDELVTAISKLNVRSAPVPLFYDVKGRQLRVEEAFHYVDHLELRLNHPIRVDLRDPRARRVLFKAGTDVAILDRIEEDGKRLIFQNGRDSGPTFKVEHGESLHIRHPSLQVLGDLFTEQELKKIEAAKAAGFTRYFLSYTESQSDVDQLRELVGNGSELWLKIENEKGLQYVESTFKKKDNVTLVTARGDLFVELPRPHDIVNATRLMIEKDPQACIGSRILLSFAQRALPACEREHALKAVYEQGNYRRGTVSEMTDLLVAIFHDPTPSCADLSELAWLYDIGYRRFLLCDELCLHKTLLNPAINTFRAFERET